MPCLPVDSAMSCSAQLPNPTRPEPVSASTTFSAPALCAAAIAAASTIAGLSGASRASSGAACGGLVEELADVDAGQRRGHQAERGERRVAPADAGVGLDERAVALLAGEVGELRARVGDHDHPRRRVDAVRLEDLGEDPPLAVGLDRAAGLRRHDEHGAAQVAGERVGDLARVGGVEHDQGVVPADGDRPSGWRR